MPPHSKDVTVQIDDAHIVFRNFSGEERKYNKKGDRNFCVILPPDLAEQMEQDNWLVKYLEPREEGEERKPYIKVTVGYKGRPPSVYLISSRGRTALDEETVGMLDVVYTSNVDLIMRAYDWTLDTGATGRKAYLKSMYLTMAEDELDVRYADVPDAAPIGAGDHNEEWREH